MQTVAIFGVGLIGGSFALALRQAGFKGRILGVSSPATIEKAVARGVIDEGAPVGVAAAAADLVYLSQPIEAILSTLHQVDAHVRPGTLITDAGSTKAEIVRRAARDVKSGVFLGGHPMAGKESRGVEAADAGLFAGRPYVLTPAPGMDLESGTAAELKTFIQAMGARLVILDPAGHDRYAALISHLPQLASTALAEVIGAEPAAAQVAGPASVDLTRLALSPYDIWRDIFATNTASIDRVLGAYIEKLQQLRAELGKPSSESAMESAFERAADAATKLRKQS